MEFDYAKIILEQAIAEDILQELITYFAIKSDYETDDVERDFFKGCLNTYEVLKIDVDNFISPVVDFVLDSYMIKKNGGKRIDMDRLRIAHQLGKKLEQCGVQHPRVVAEYWVERAQAKTDFFDTQDQETLEFIKSTVDIQEIDDPMGFADAFINGKKNIEEVYNYLLNFYTKDELKEHYRKNFDLFIFKLEDVRVVADYLKSMFEQEDFKSILVNAIILGIDECKERNELVLKYFGDKDFLVYLAKNGGLYYPHYYADIVGGINYIVEELGIKKAKTLLKENELFLILYRREEYRDQYITLYEDAMRIVERYKEK